MKNKKALSDLICSLRDEKNLPDEALFSILSSDEADEILVAEADRVRRLKYGTKVYLRGLIEFTNFCKNDCYYCGIRHSNKNAERYRLSEDEILSVCRDGFSLGLRTFVLQGGEDPFFTDDKICRLTEKIKALFPNCAVTLSLGERKKESYRAFKESGADRYLLRHETADRTHYATLHPSDMSFDERRRCLYDLKDLGFQVGSGFMVGSPGQTLNHIIKDLKFLSEFDADMVGIGPFIHHKYTPFAHQDNGSAFLTIKLVSMVRLMLPHALIPATTALGTLYPGGRLAAITSGANVVMPNLSPFNVRKKYSLYENKIRTGEETAEEIGKLKESLKSAGYDPVIDKGDVKR